MTVLTPMTPRRHHPRHATSRRGFTIAEMVVALLLFSLVGGGIMSLVMRQQRFYRSTAEIIQLQAQLRQGGSVLPLELRGISTGDMTANSVGTANNADIYRKGDWYIEFRRFFGASMICAKRGAAPLDTLTLLPKQTDSAASLSAWGIPPVVGDSILVLDEGKLIGTMDDIWVAYEVRGLTEVSGLDGCPWKTAGDNSPVLWLADTARKSYKLALDRELPVNSTILLGAPLRFFRRVRYEAFQAGDEKWYLGYSDCLRTYGTVTGCSEVTPVAGPFSPYVGVEAEDGLRFTYYDSLGTKLATTDPSNRVARIDVVMRSVTAKPVTRTGSGPGEHRRESMALSIGVRNRR